MPYDATPRSSVRAKLAYYLLGLAIGFVLLGIIAAGRSRTQPPVPVAAPVAAPAGTTGGAGR